MQTAWMDVETQRRLESAIKKRDELNTFIKVMLEIAVENVAPSPLKQGQTSSGPN